MQHAPSPSHEPERRSPDRQVDRITFEPVWKPALHLLVHGSNVRPFSEVQIPPDAVPQSGAQARAVQTLARSPDDLRHREAPGLRSLQRRFVKVQREIQLSMKYGC